MDIKGYSFKEGLFYDKDHGWLQDNGDVLTLGVTDFFQKVAGEIVFIEIPIAGRKIDKGQPYSSIESGKWVGRLKAPVSGEIIEVNSDLEDCPYIINDEPYEGGWVIKIRPDNKGELKELYTLGEQFATFIAEEEKKIKEGTR